MARSDFAELEKYIPDEEALTAFRRLMAYQDSLKPEDEIAKIIETMGLFALIANKIPAQLVERTEQLTAALDRATKIPAETKAALENFSINNERLEAAAAALGKKADTITASFDARNGWIVFLIFVIGVLSGILAMRIFF